MSNKSIAAGYETPSLNLVSSDESAVLCFSPGGQTEDYDVNVYTWDD